MNLLDAHFRPLKRLFSILRLSVLFGAFSDEEFFRWSEGIPKKYGTRVSQNFDSLLDKTIAHLQDLKEGGVRYLDIDFAKFEGFLTNSGPEKSAQRNSPVPARAVSPPPAARPEEQSSAPLRDPRSETPRAPAVQGPPTEAKAQAIAELRERALQCVKCPNLASSRKNVVFGVGNIDAELMFVGEAPGADEDQAGEPFVGKAGQLLTKIIQTMGLGRDQVYIANILKCRPDTPGQSAGNRKPTTEEMQTCIPYLHAQIDLIQPKVLVALGATAVEGLLGKTQGITRLRGQWKTYRGIPLMPTYHPAYLLRNQALNEKRRVWEDMLEVMERLGMPVSERQRSFFLK